MRKRAVPGAASIALAALAASFAACSAKPAPPGAAASPPAPLRAKPNATPEPLLGPARYILAEGVGVSFDEAGRASALPRREPAIASGNRFLLDGGLVLAEARGPEALSGFRSLPARLGGGYVFWSDARTYRADTFLGELRPIAQIAAEGGARPWLDTLVLRTDLGLLELDPRAPTPALRRTDLARFAEAFSLDGKHGVRLDAFGRAEITTDGGKTFRDLTAERGDRVFSFEEGESGTLLLLPGAGRQPTLALDPAKGLVPVAATPQNDLGVGMTPTSASEPLPSSRQLAPYDLPGAVFAGARLPGGRALVTREQIVRVLALGTGQLLDDALLTGVAEPYTRCQPITLGAEVLLACTHPHGAHVLAFRDDPSAPRLEATFPEPSAFIAGLGARFAFTGRCGALVPAVADFRGAPPVSEPPLRLFGPSESESTAPPGDPPEPLDPTPADEAYICVRAADGTWTERRLLGEDASHLYRFLPGDGGTATALVLRGKDTKTAPPPAPEGVRILRVDPDDPALGGAVFPAALTPMEDPPYRSIDRDFWLDEKDGSLHGWVVLPPEGEDPAEALERDPIPQGRSERMLPVSTRLGGRFAGVHIQPDGRVVVHPLPPGVVEVLRGGAFALARADNDGAATYHETTDGGRTFRPVVAPPVGELNAPYDANVVQGCSELGCALGDGVVRLGWGSPAPAAPPDVPPDIAPAPEPPAKRLGSLPLRCRLERSGAPAPRGESKTDAGPPPLPASLRTPPGVAVGVVRAGSFQVDVGLPFDPRAPRRATFKAPTLTRVEGAIVPVLLATDASPVGLFLRTSELRFDLGLPGGPPSTGPVALKHHGVFTSAADLGRGDLLTLNGMDGELSFVRGGLVRRFTEIARVSDVTRHRLGLARRRGDAASPRLAVSAVSGTSGDILLADLDLARATLGPVRAAGSLTNLDPSPACRPDPDAYRLLAEVLVDVQFDPPHPDHDAPSLGATALVAVSAGRTCLEGLEVRLPRNNTTLVVRFPSPGASLVREAGRSDAAICSSP
ncbi:hypothetical protein [Polyangium mundeleinium]|uniref:Uncharacterized protein n=1 Tax=Polyangium mundeleinium TaxID=2995306 RepID=A0ABT5EL41_9BACT|nr:hypothetical protein [Polyangium mundeleinium]MDC0742064.1 hypothetical protein [Polyangium mundeleinium]